MTRARVRVRGRVQGVFFRVEARDRARSLGLVTDRQVRNFREKMKANGWLVTEPVEYRGNEQASRLRRLLSDAVAESIIAPERAAALAGVSSAAFLGELGNVF